MTHGIISVKGIRFKIMVGEDGGDVKFSQQLWPNFQGLEPSVTISDIGIKMAKAASIKIKLLSTANTGFFYVTKKNSRTMTEKMSMSKYDPVVRKHVDFKETKIK